MIEQQILREKLQSAQREWRRARAHLCYFGVYLLASVVCFAIAWNVRDLPWMTASGSWWLLFVPVIIAVALASWASRPMRLRRQAVRQLELQHPELDGLLVTAEGLLEKPELNVLEQRVISAATDHGASHDWSATLTRSRGRTWKGLMFFGLLLWVNAFLLMNRRWEQVHVQPEAVVAAVTETKEVQPGVVTLTPGDTEIERGSRLIVEAKFDSQVPVDATLVVTEMNGDERERLPMKLTVDEQVFGGLIARVDRDARYHVEFAGGRSQEHQITTFIYPALERADVKITPPPYAGLPTKELKNTLKVTAMEGSDLAFTFKTNKPVKDAELFGEDKTILPLKASADDPTLLTASLKAEKTQKWRLHLVDAQERANKNPPWISVKVQSNQLAKIEVVFPKRDIQVSAIQELPVEARVWDDLSVTQSGVSFSIAGRSKDVVFKHSATQPAKKLELKELLDLENESAEPRQLVSYHFWAEDKGPQGEIRRAMSDMFFADVRHFEDIFREAEAPPSEPGMPEKKTDLDKLVELQKQVVNATWRLIRDTNAGRAMEAASPDVDVVHESQSMALEQTKELMEKVEDAEIKNALTEAWKSMKDVLEPLEMASAEKKRSPLNQALTFEQSALEWLHRAQSREHRVMRQNQPSQSSTASEKARQNQIMNLELKQGEQRYEQERQASPEQTAEQQENLQVLNRLKELARRQEALAEKMKELQKQIEKAKTEEEKQELENQLQRLQEEQEQLLRDVDELKDRMESPENATNMAEAREQLEQTREQVMDAAEKLKQQQLADAANAATRAQRELEDMQEDFKQKTAKRFSDEMKQVRQQAREIAEAQKQISESLENQKTPQESGDTSATLEKMLDGSQVARQLEEQGTRVNDLLENMRRISEQAEGSNPLLHRRLYEAVRNAQTGGLEENLEEARIQSRYGNRADAQDAERKAATSVDELQKGVQKAAESVLGSETEALRMARNELDRLIKEVEAEAQGGASSDSSPSSKEGQPSPTNQTAQAEKGEAPSRAEEGEPKMTGQGQGQEADPKTANQSPSQEGQPSGRGQPAGDGEPPPNQQSQPNSMAQNPSQAGQGQEKGQSPGQGSESKGQEGDPSSQTAQKGSPGKEGSQTGGQQASAPNASGQGQGQGAEQPGSQGQSPGESGSPSSNQPQMAEGGQRVNGGQQSGGGNSSAGGRNLSGDDRRGSRSASMGGGGFFFDEGVEVVDRGPLTGEGYADWSDRLRNVEELLEQPELRNEAAKVLDNARALRIDHERNNESPQAEHLAMRITQPLVELRDRVAEELAKKGPENPMVPVDRDPVPPAFRDLVKRYYQELGHGN